MQNTMLKSLYLAGTLLLFCGGGAFAQDSLTLLSPPNTGNANAGGVYTSPYNISVNGVALQLVCDDYLNDISVGETWLANVTTLTTLTSSSVSSLLFGSTGSSGSTPPSAAPVYSNIAEDYAVAAVLVAELMLLPNYDSVAAEGYSFAIWDVFDTNAGAPTGLASLASGDLTAAENLVTAAMKPDGSVDLSQISVNGQSIASLTVYTPTNDIPNGGGGSVPQEFLQVSMPEPSYPAVLAVDLLAIVGLMVALRRRITGIFN